MGKFRGLRMGRAVVRVCRRLVWRRRRPRRASYIRLGVTSASSSAPRGDDALYAAPSAMQHTSSERSSCCYKQATVAGKLWNLCRRPFAISSGWFQFHRVPRGLGAKASGRYDRGGGAGLPFVDDYCGSQQQQQQQQQQACKPPKGHLVVYVGKGGSDGGPPPHRVVVPVMYFNHPLFGELLRQAEQEYGFHHPGGITIPCPISDFESVRERVAAASEASASDLHVRTASGRIWRWHS